MTISRKPAPVGGTFAGEGRQGFNLVGHIGHRDDLEHHAVEMNVVGRVIWAARL